MSRIDYFIKSDPQIRKQTVESNVNADFLTRVMELIGNITMVVKETDYFGIFSCKFELLCISQMFYQLIHEYCKVSYEQCTFVSKHCLWLYTDTVQMKHAQ